MRSDSGGAAGMLFFVDRSGRKFFVGGLNQANAQRLTDALNLALELLERRPDS